MAGTMHDYVTLFGLAVNTVDHLLAKGAAFAAERGIAESDMLQWRIAEDMHPLSFQVAVVVNFARGWTARAAGVDVPQAIESAALDLAGLRAALADARAFVASFPVDAFAGREDAPISFRIGDLMEPTLPAARWLQVFALTNIQFHTSMAYAILRHHGVPLGKPDMFPSGL